MSSPTDEIIQIHKAEVTAFLDHLPQSSKNGAYWQYAGAVRHFVFWLEGRGLSLDDADEKAIERFRRHRCRCPRRGKSNGFRSTLYLSRIRRFLRFISDRCNGARADTDTALLARVQEHVCALQYSAVTAQAYLSEAEHFLVWLRTLGIDHGHIDDGVIERFGNHHCRCPIFRKRGRLKGPAGPARRRRGARFVANFLKEPEPQAFHLSTVPDTTMMAEYEVWLRCQKGLTASTLRRYIHEVNRWGTVFGEDWSQIDTTRIRCVFRDQPENRSDSSIRLTATVLRSWIQFLSVRGPVSPDLMRAVPTICRSRSVEQQTALHPEAIERVIDACDCSTPVGLRDRAILLLLARLGLRAGDIWTLRMDRLNWSDASITLTGKGGLRTDRMPLPQDAGDALLDYIESGRPASFDPHVFIRAQAPHRAFSSAAEISGIVSRARLRAGETDGPTGAHAFRHALATRMLREGTGLMAIGAVLRHKKPTTTALYAHPNREMLDAIAQPWPGDASC